MKRGDLVVVTVSGDYGKPRPALVVQADYFNETHASVTVIPVTSTIVDAPLFRITLEPTPTNGLRSISQLMVDKMTTVSRDRVGRTIGHAGNDVLVRAKRAMALWLGLTA
ncbi:MAG: type II toxin-antitoxin system PemK/MazF family toxin [Acidobacteria bacterium]|nr:type II toxin-antitoxin system PemK/MazF family toxin [Acidobacteriota bacterium]